MPHQRKCTKSKTEVTHPSKRIILPISLLDYQQIVAELKDALAEMTPSRLH